MSNNKNKSKNTQAKTKQEQAAKARAKARAARALEEEQAFYEDLDAYDEDETDILDDSDLEYIDDIVDDFDNADTVTFVYKGRKVTAVHAESLPYEFLAIAAEEETSGLELGGIRLVSYFLKNALSDEDKGFYMRQKPAVVQGLFEKWNVVCGAKKKG